MKRLLLILLCVSLIGRGQTLEKTYKSDTTLESVFSLAIKQHYGFVIIHSRAIRAIKNSHPMGTEFNFSWQKIDKKSWELCHCYPKVGILLSFFDFDNKKILGYGFNVAGFVEPFFQIDKKFNISFRTAAGLSLDTEPYDEFCNPENFSYSLPINGYLQLGLILHYQVNPKIKLTVSSNFNHISNGGLKQPNKGVNYPTIGMGLDYTPKPISFKNRKKTEYIGIKKKRYDLSVSYFPKKVIDNSKYFTVFGINTGISHQIGRISALTVDLELIWDHSLKWKIETLNKDKNYQRGGLLVGHEFLMGRVTFSQKIGPYIYDVAKYDDPIYQRYGINFHITENVFTGIHIKAHRHIADFMEIKIGWTF